MSEKEMSIIELLNELREYRKIGTLEEVSKMIKEDVVKFYYCESEDEYLIGLRTDTLYYAKYNGNSWTWYMSRYLPWGQHVVSPGTAWKEYTYPSEPKEMFFTEWLVGFLKKCAK